VIYVIIAVLAVVGAVMAAPLLRFENPMRELDRWWTARHLTTGWARGGDEV
jgi:hypothetical protein